MTMVYIEGRFYFMNQNNKLFISLLNLHSSSASLIHSVKDTFNHFSILGSLPKRKYLALFIIVFPVYRIVTIRKLIHFKLINLDCA